jgi:glutamine cyclotransferase
LLRLALALAAGIPAGRGADDAGPAPATAAPGTVPAPVWYSYEVVRVWPHDPAAFTQGLVFRDGTLLESTGLFGASTLREVELATGRVQRQISIPDEFFAEGLAVIGPRAYQLTWRNHTGFIYDVATFHPEGQFHYEGEGWGLTTDGTTLILSDGTDRIRFLDPVNFQVVHTIRVTAAGQPVVRLNELEWVRGELYANVWQTDQVVRIDPATGAVRGIIDFTGLLPPGDRGPGTDVLNGIAYDAAHDRLFVTGKRWPKIFEVRLNPRAAAP